MMADCPASERSNLFIFISNYISVLSKSVFQMNKRSERKNNMQHIYLPIKLAANFD